MAFFVLLISVWIVLWVFSKFGISKLNSHSYKGRLAFSAGFLFIGISHLVKPEELAYMIEGFMTYALLIVYFTGIVEILLAVLLQVHRYQKITAWLIIAYLIAIFPANVNVALNNLNPPGGLPAEPWYTWSRLLFQPVYILWVFFSAIKPKQKMNS